MRHRLLIPMLVTALAAGFYACGVGSRGNGEDNSWSRFAAFDHTEWLYGAPMDFVVEPLRDSVPVVGTLMLYLRHTAGYEYSNIWLELSYPDTDSTLRADTLNVRLADVFGHWRGKGSGASFALTDTIHHRFRITRGDTIRLRHIMRIDTLPNIEQVGLVFYPDEQ